MRLFDFFKKKAKNSQESSTPESARPEKAANEGQAKTLPRVSAAPKAEGTDDYDLYVKFIGDTYVMRKQLHLTEEELEEMSITDCAEAWRLYLWYNNTIRPKMTEEEEQEARERVARVVEGLSAKLLAAEELYCLFNRRTGLPHLFSQTLKQEGGGYVCTPPAIRVFTEQSLSVAKTYPEAIFDLKKIESGEDGKGIRHFFETCAFVYGADAISVVSEVAHIDLETVVTLPDFSHLPEVQQPVVNPDVLRWLTLMNQIDSLETDSAKQIYMLYASLLDQQLPGARFLVPTEIEKDAETSDDSQGFNKGDSFSMVVMDGKKGRKAIHLFTDWLAFRETHDSERYKGMIMTIEGLIERFDIALNPNPVYQHSGCYIDQETFERAKKSQGQ